MTCCRGVLRGARHAQLVGLDGHLDLEFLVLDVLVDLFGGGLVDALDDATDQADGAAGGGLGSSQETVLTSTPRLMSLDDRMSMT